MVMGGKIPDRCLKSGASRGFRPRAEIGRDGFTLIFPGPLVGGVDGGVLEQELRGARLEPLNLGDKNYRKVDDGDGRPAVAFSFLAGEGGSNFEAARRYVQNKYGPRPDGYTI